MKSECFLNFDLALKLASAGFDWPCGYHYNRRTKSLIRNSPDCNFNDGNDRFISAPTLETSRKWLREIMSIDVIVNIKPDDNHVLYYSVVYHHGMEVARSQCKFLQYEDAVQVGIDKALEFLNINQLSHYEEYNALQDR